MEDTDESLSESLYIQVLPDTSDTRVPLRPQRPAPNRPALGGRRSPASQRENRPPPPVPPRPADPSRLDTRLHSWDDLCAIDLRKRENQASLCAAVLERIRRGVQLFQQVLFEHGTGIMNSITQLNCLADDLERTKKSTRIAGVTGGTTGAIGAAAIVAGIVLAPATFGASLAITGIGAGVAVAGGVTGASAVIHKKVRESQDQRKVEKILRSHQRQMEEVEERLRFVLTGMELLRRFNIPLSGEALAAVGLAEQFPCSDVFNALRANTHAAQSFTSSLDLYFSQEDAQQLKTGSEKAFAAEVRQVALKLKHNMDQIMHIKNTLLTVFSV